jgi:hypothetical protein
VLRATHRRRKSTLTRNTDPTGIRLARVNCPSIRQPAPAVEIGWRVVASVVGMLAIGILGRAPCVDGQVVLAAMLAGIGALPLQLRPRTVAAAASRGGDSCGSREAAIRS